MPKLYHDDDRWIVPGQQTKQAARHDIPSTPVELAVWLNDRAVAAAPKSSPDDNAQPLQREPAQPAQTIPAAPSTLDASNVEHWIMDTASGEQVERLFTALGVRFHELRKRSQTPAQDQPK